MRKSTLAARLMRSTVLTGAVAAAVAMSPAAFAQDAADEDRDTIIVTGSRIQRQDLVSNSPVTTIDAELIQQTGDLNIENILNEFPQIVPGANQSSNNPGGGQATVDLRGLGTARTLVLVNGRRFTPSDPTGVVDLNSIPPELIERVEVVTGGASAVYGSDALAGVVNFITLSDYEGFEVFGQYGLSEESDADRYTISAKFGANTADGRGNVTGAVSYFYRDNVLQSERDFSAVDNSGGSATGRVRLDNSGLNPFPLTPTGVTLNSGADCGSARNIAFSDDGTARGFCNVLDVDGGDRYNFSPVNNLVVPQERFAISTLGRYELFGDKAEAYFEGYFVNNEVANQLAPTPLAASGTRQALVTPGVTPFLDASALALLAARPDPNAPAVLRRRLTEAGPRIATFNSNVFNIVTGLRGEIVEGWNYDVFYSYQRSEFVNTLENDQSISRIQSSLDNCPVGSPDGCLPIDFFSAGGLTPEAVDYISVNAITQQLFERNNFQANVSGELFQLPAGALALAAGFEYREDSLEFIPDDTFQSGDLTGFNAQQPIAGTTDVYEIYGEVVIPVLKDLPLVHAFNIEAGGRYSDYSTESVGGVTSWKAGGDWSLTEDFRIRGLYQRAIRAPSVFELFRAGDQNFPGYSDPCAGIAPTGATVVVSAATQAACTAQFAAFGLAYPGPTFTQTNAQFEQLLFGGPDLGEERSRTFTVGAVYTPSFIDNLTITVDYFNIQVDDVVGRRFAGDSVFGSADGALDLCIAQGGVALAPGAADPCFGVRRLSNGDAQIAFSDLANLSDLETRGIDFALNYGFATDFLPSPVAGDFRFSVNGTRLLNFTFDGLDQTDTNFGTGSSFPTWRFNARFNYQVGPLNTSWQTQFVGEVSDANGVPVSHRLYHDFGLQYELGENYQFSFGINNVFDRQPPEFSFLASTQANTDPGQYDVIGRYYFVGLRARF